MRKPIIAGNWKMHKTAGEAAAVVRELVELTRDAKDVEIVICPAFTSLHAVHEVLAGSNIKLGAQNVHWEKSGAYTGEIAAEMLKEAGCQYAIVGHSERRQYFGESDETVNKRIKAALAGGLIPILCVGESLEQRETGITETVVGTQVRAGLAGLAAEKVSGLVVAYEPVWAIGTGRTASSDDANTVCRFIRATVAALSGEKAAGEVRIQYGGSVKPSNIAELMAKSDIDGALVGGASLKAGEFSNIVKF